MKKSGFIDSVRVKEPCTESWDEMTGNDQVRFCSHCSKNVNNISEMTRREMRKLVLASGGQLCVRYVQHPLTNAPVFSGEFVQIARRASRFAAGVMSASLTMSTVAFAQGSASAIRQNSDPQTAESTESKRAAIASDSGAISGTITDPNGAVIPGSIVDLIDRNGDVFRRISSDNEGAFEFENVPVGTYKVEVNAAGFTKSVLENLTVEGARHAPANVTMYVSGEMVLMGVVASAVEYEGEVAAAVYGEDIDAVSDLIARGENVNKREEDRTTPLFIAVQNGNIEMVQLLLAHGAKVNARNKAKQTPLMRLDESTSIDLVQLLVSYGAKVDVSDETGYTPLMIAAAGADAEVVNVLISAGSKIDAQNDEGTTALIIAAGRGDVEVVKALLAAGANVNLKDSDGDTAWDQTDNQEIEDLLVGHGYIVPQEEVVQEETQLVPPPNG